MEKTIYLQDVYMYTAAGSTPASLYTTVDARLMGGHQKPVAIPTLNIEVDLLSRYDAMLRYTISTLLAKHQVERIYVQAPQKVYGLLLTLLPKHALQIIYTEIDLSAVRTPCLVLAVDSLLQKSVPHPGESAVAMLLTSEPDKAIAKFTTKKFSADLQPEVVVFSTEVADETLLRWHNFSEAHKLTAAVTYLYPALGALGRASDLTGICYALGRLEFPSNTEKTIHYVKEDAYHEKYQCVEVSRL